MHFKFHKHLRLRQFNYASSHACFITICSANRQQIFGEVIDGSMKLSAIGTFAEQSWLMIPVVSPYASLDVFVIMPDHMHGIIILDNPDEPKALPVVHSVVRPNSISAIIRDFKSAVTTRSRKHTNDPRLKVWQSSFVDRIIRSPQEFFSLRRYIMNNPARWNSAR